MIGSAPVISPPLERLAALWASALVNRDVTHVLTLSRSPLRWVIVITPEGQATVLLSGAGGDWGEATLRDAWESIAAGAGLPLIPTASRLTDGALALHATWAAAKPYPRCGSEEHLALLGIGGNHE